MRSFPELLPVRVSAGACLTLALMLLVLPLPWCAAAMLAGAVHEAGHLLALKAAGCPCREIRFGSVGAVMEACTLPPVSSIACSLAGPAAGLLLLPLCRQIPRTVLCAAAQSCFNLLPLPGLDGGQIADNLCGLLFSERVGRIVLRCLHGLSAAALFLLSAVAAVSAKLYFLPALTLILAICKLQAGKKSCKYTLLRVQ